MPLPAPFIVIATQNPIEYEGTFPLPEAQLDRFLIKLSVGYPSLNEEQEILKRRRERRTDAFSLQPVTDTETLLAMRGAIEEVYLDPDLEGYIVRLVHQTRVDNRIAVGASPRGSLALLKLARAQAALAGREYVLPDDIKAFAKPALIHRLILNPELWLRTGASRPGAGQHHCQHRRSRCGRLILGEYARETITAGQFYHIWIGHPGLCHSARPADDFRNSLFAIPRRRFVVSSDGYSANGHTQAQRRPCSFGYARDRETHSHQ